MIPFKNIPAGLRMPLFYAELDASRANTSARPQRALLIGQKTVAGTLPPNVPVISQSNTDATAAAGPGSVLSGMANAYRKNDPTGELWLLPLADDATATAATGQIVITAVAAGTSPGTFSLYIAGHLVSVPLGPNQTAATVVATIAAVVNALQDLPVTASGVGGQTPGSTLTFTAKNKGPLGNDIDLRVNYLGAAAGEVLPFGISVQVTPMTGGATAPSLVAALNALGDTPFDFIVCSLIDTASLAAIATLLGDVNGRWSWSSQVYGHCFTAYRGTAGAAAAFATALNNQHISCVPFNDSPSTTWRWAAAFAGAAAVSLREDPAVPLQCLQVQAVLAPPIGSRFPLSIRANTLLYGGCATWTVDASGAVVVENLITTYVTNATGQPDNSYLQTETLFQLAYVLRRLSDVVTTKFGRVKLAADGVRLLPGSNAVTPSIIRADLIATYRQLEAEGQVQNSAAFSAGLVVEKDANNPNRVNVSWPGTLVGQLRTFALLAQFRLV